MIMIVKCFKYWTGHIEPVPYLEEDEDVVQQPLPPPGGCTLTQTPPPRPSEGCTLRLPPKGCMSTQPPEGCTLTQAPPPLPLEQDVFRRRSHCKEWAIQVGTYLH